VSTAANGHRPQRASANWQIILSLHKNIVRRGQRREFSPRRVDILPDKPRDLSNKEISKCCPRPSAHAKPDIPVPTIANFGLFDSILMPTNLQLCFSSSEFK
jgi:hypothetical protein